MTASRSSRPSRGNIDQTSCSCCSRRPGLPGTRCDHHAGPRHQARHSRPRLEHKQYIYATLIFSSILFYLYYLVHRAARECSTSCPRSCGPCTSAQPGGGGAARLMTLMSRHLARTEKLASLKIVSVSSALSFHFPTFFRSRASNSPQFFVFTSCLLVFNNRIQRHTTRNNIKNVL